MIALLLILLHLIPVCPTDGWRTSAWGRRVHPITKRVKWHRGLDIGAPKGTEARAMWAGHVLRARRLRGGYGNYVLVRTATFTLLYAHLDEILVEPGTEVRAGQTIGRVGSSGSATGSHLHLEVRKGRRRTINPERFLGHCPDLP